MIRLIHKETIKDKTKYDYETDNFSTHRRHDIMFTGTGKNRTVTENDSLGNKKRVIELRDTTIDGKTVTDTLSIMTYEGSSSDSKSDKGWKHHNGSGWDWDFDLDGKTSETIISVTAIVFIFGLPLLIVFTVFFFNYKIEKPNTALQNKHFRVGNNCLKTSSRMRRKQKISVPKVSKTSSLASDYSSSSGPLPRTLE